MYFDRHVLVKIGSQVIDVGPYPVVAQSQRKAQPASCDVRSQLSVKATFMSSGKEEG
jgi:hypothetical protein